jgi:hypothetical protein
VTGDIREQLTAALDEAERIARAAVEGNGWNGQPLTGRWYSEGSGHSWIVTDESGQPVAFDEGEPTEARAAHMARWDPATVLRLVERDRALLDDLAEAEAGVQANVRAFDQYQAGQLIAATARCKAVRAQADRAAALWLGTPEGSGG